jgi:hypothetical protein
MNLDQSKIYRSMTDAEEGRFVAVLFLNKMQNQMTNGQFAILYRTTYTVSFYGRCFA